MSTITIKLSNKELEEVESFIQILTHEKKTTPNYAMYSYQIGNCRVTAYPGGKLLFQGNDCKSVSDLLLGKNKKLEVITMNEQYPQAGSDEVGTGDYFGPVVVCACIVNPNDVDFLNQLGVNDSKMMTDELILKIGPQLIQRLLYSLLVLDNAKYNEIHPHNNMVAIKAKLHNQAYVHLRKKANGLPSLCIVDQFVAKNTYYKYLQGQPEVVEGLHFETKAEHKYLAVAASSVIARYAFLKKMEEMNHKFGMIFEKAASYKVDQSGVQFVKKYRQNALNEVAKIHFVNTKKILATLS